MKRSLLLPLAVFGCALLQAQHPSISGLVTSTSGTALPGVSITLKTLPTGLPAVTSTDSSGKYHFSGLAVGKYLLVATHTGFLPQTSDTLVLGDKAGELNWSPILAISGNELENVTVRAKGNPVQIDAGKMTFNIQNQATTAGQTAFDVLKKIPGVGVDQDENILFRGASGVNIMVDGKMTYLTGTQLTNYLKGLSADDLSKIELITQPGAAFDAAGNSGIIQLITRKKKTPGYAIDIRSTATWSKWWLWNENISANLRTGKWTLYGSFDFNTPHRYYDKRSGNTLPGSNDSLRLDRIQETIFKVKYYTYRLGMEWQFHPKHAISFRYHGYFDDWKGTHYTTVDTRKQPSQQLNGYVRSINSLVEPYHYDAPSFSYRFDIDSMGKKITADVDYTAYRNYSDGLLATRAYSPTGEFTGENQLRVHQPGFIQLQSFKADAELPFTHFQLAAGLKWASVENDNQFQYDSLQNGQFVPAESMSNHFRYKEKIAAAYLSLAKRWKKTRVTAGLRLENTDARGYTVKGGQGNQWKYTQLFPSASITRQLGEDHETSVSVSRRINRPTYSNLNPVRWYSDQYFYFSGNPYLVPDLAWTFAGTYSFQKKYVVSVSYNRSNNYISRQLVLDGDAVKSISANLGEQQRLDITLSLPFQPLRFWTIQAFTDISFTRYPISRKAGLVPASAWANTSTLQQTFSLPGGWEATLNASYYSAELLGIYKTVATGFIDAGVKRSFLQKKLTAQFNCNDIFNTNRYKAFSQTDIIDYYYNDKQYTRQLSLSLIYHIGGTTFKSGHRKTEEQERL